MHVCVRARARARAGAFCFAAAAAAAAAAGGRKAPAGRTKAGPPEAFTRAACGLGVGGSVEGLAQAERAEQDGWTKAGNEWGLTGERAIAEENLAAHAHWTRKWA